MVRGVWAGLFAGTAAFGQFFPISTPTVQYTSSTASVPIAVPDLTLIGSVTGGGQTVTFPAALTAATVPSGWNFWGSPPNTESSTPRVVFTDPTVTSVTLTLSAPANTFGFEVEPSNRGTTFPAPPTQYAISATFLNGSTVLGTVTRAIPEDGALLEAASSVTPITSVVVTAPLAAGGFALAQFRFGNGIIGAPSTAIPALDTPALSALSMMLAATGALLARSNSAVRA